MLGGIVFTGNTTAAGQRICALTASAVDCRLSGNEGSIALSKLRGHTATTHALPQVCVKVLGRRSPPSLQTACEVAAKLQQADSLDGCDLGPLQNVLACLPGVRHDRGRIFPTTGAGSLKGGGAGSLKWSV